MKKNIIVISLILVVFLSFPIFALAQGNLTQDQIKQQLIQTLTQLIIQLQAQINAILAQKTQVAPVITLVAPPLTGQLNLLKNGLYGDQNILAAKANFKLADFSLTNNTIEAIDLNNIEVDLLVNSNQYIANLYVNNLYLTIGDSKTLISSMVLTKNNWQVNSQLAVGKTIGLSVYADINASIPLNSNVITSILVSGTSINSRTTVSTNSGVVFAGQTITFGVGSLSVSQDGSTPSAGMYISNQKIIAGKFQITSVADSYNVYQLKFAVPGLSFMPIISDAVLADSTTKISLGTASIQSDYLGSNSYFIFNVNIPILANSTKYLTVYYDLGSVNSLEVFNTNIAPALIYINATNSDGTYIDGAAGNYNSIAPGLHGGISLPVVGVTVNSVKVFKSLPTFASAQISGDVTISGSTANLYTLTISADQNGDVSLKQLTFIITINDPNNGTPYFNNFKFFKGSTDYSNYVSIGNIYNGNYMGLKTNNGGIGIGIANTVVVYFSNEETVKAGKKQTYTLKADASRFVRAGTYGADSVSTYIPSDSTQIDGGSYLGPLLLNANNGLIQTHNYDYSLVNQYNLLWSDKSSNDHGDSSSSSKDWYNGFGILNLPLPIQTVSAK